MSVGNLLALHTFIIASIVLWLRVVRLLDAKKNESVAKEQEAKNRAKLLEVVANERLTRRIEATKDFVELIRGLIDEQVYGRLSLLEVLKQAYPIRELDNDVKEMSDKVFRALDKNAFKAADSVMNYIIDQTTVVLSVAVTDYNAKIYAKSADLQ